MATLRILHLSDLPGLFQHVDTAQELGERLLRAGNERPFDHLVVCGNLTEDADEAGFGRAREFLLSFGPVVLGVEQEEALSRTLVVPGRADVRDRNLGPFENFLENLGHPWKPTLQPIQAHRTHGVLLIGALYWEGAPLEQLSQGLQILKERLSEYEYYRRRFCILATGDSPLTKEDRDRFVKEASKIWPINLHLVGKAEPTCFVPTPHCVRHYTLAIGPAREASAHFNVIEVNGDSPRPEKWQYEAGSWGGEKFAGRTISLPTHLIPESEDATEAKAEPGQAVYTCFLRQIEELIDDGKKVILITGLPGSGKKYLFNDLSAHRSIKIRGKRRLITCEQLDIRVPPSTRPGEVSTEYLECRRRLERRVNALTARVVGQAENLGLLLVYDHVLPQPLAAPREEIPGEVDVPRDGEDRAKLMLLRDQCVVANRRGEIVLLYFSANMEIRKCEHEINSDVFAHLRLRGLAGSHFELLMREHVPYVPLHPDVLKNLTGGYYKLSERLLVEARAQFQIRRDNINPTSETEELVKGILKSRWVCRERSWFENNLRSLLGEEEYFEKLRAASIGHGVAPAALDLRELVPDTKVVENLVEYGVFSDLEGGRCKLLVTFPFRDD